MSSSSGSKVFGGGYFGLALEIKYTDPFLPDAGEDLDVDDGGELDSLEALETLDSAVN